VKVGVVGSREFDDYEQLEHVLNQLNNVTCIVSGGAKGADSLGEKYADENGLEKIIHLPDWDTHGKGAGFVRNTAIVRDADLVVAFWDGKSRGTRDTISKTFNSTVPLLIIHYKTK
jgi:hypothetical protein